MMFERAKGDLAFKEGTGGGGGGEEKEEEEEVRLQEGHEKKNKKDRIRTLMYLPSTRHVQEGGWIGADGRTGLEQDDMRRWLYLISENGWMAWCHPRKGVGIIISWLLMRQNEVGEPVVAIWIGVQFSTLGPSPPTHPRFLGFFQWRGFESIGPSNLRH